MGMYTSIRHPKDGRELQIKTGDDCCEIFNIGDKVEQHIDPNNYGSGQLFDGVYESYSNHGVDDWVIIQDSIIKAVLPKKTDINEIRNTYKFRPIDSLYTKVAIKKHKKILKEIDQELKDKKAKFKKDFKLSNGREPNKDDLVWFLMVQMMSSGINYTSIGRKILQVEEIKPLGGNSIDYTRR